MNKMSLFQRTTNNIINSINFSIEVNSKNIFTNNFKYYYCFKCNEYDKPPEKSLKEIIKYFTEKEIKCNVIDKKCVCYYSDNKLVLNLSWYKKPANYNENHPFYMSISHIKSKIKDSIEENSKNKLFEYYLKNKISIPEEGKKIIEDTFIDEKINFEYDIDDIDTDLKIYKLKRITWYE
jgi:hypothetical protein